MAPALAYSQSTEHLVATIYQISVHDHILNFQIYRRYSTMDRVIFRFIVYNNHMCKNGAKSKQLFTESENAAICST